jgi:hypothetical protein
MEETETVKLRDRLKDRASDSSGLRQRNGDEDGDGEREIQMEKQRERE